MSVKSWPRKKKIVTLSALLAALLVLCGICAAILIEYQKHSLFHFEPSKVQSITLTYGFLWRDIEDRQQIEEIVKLLNDFTYEKTEELSGDLLGESYCLYLNMNADRKEESISFNMDRIRIQKESGFVMYYGPPGYFRRLVELMTEEVKEGETK